MTVRKWFVVQTNIKCEERATKSLRAARYRVYMPVMKKTIVHHRTKDLINKRFKLFNRYLFVSMAPDNLDYGNVRKCKGVETILGIEIDGKPCEISREIIKRFMLAQRRGDFDNVVALTKKQMAAKLPVGTRIKVRHEHVFGGFYGQVTKIKGKGVIRAGLEIFGRLTPVELGAGDFDVIAVDEPAEAA